MTITMFSVTFYLFLDLVSSNALAFIGHLQRTLGGQGLPVDTYLARVEHFIFHISLQQLLLVSSLFEFGIKIFKEHFGTLHRIFMLFPVLLSLPLYIQKEKQHIGAGVILQIRIFALLDKRCAVYQLITVINTGVQLIEHEDLQGSSKGL